MNKMMMKLACSFNDWMYKKYGVLSAGKGFSNKNVHLKEETFFNMFENYERIENYSNCFGEYYDEVHVIDGDTRFFALVKSEDDF